MVFVRDDIWEIDTFLMSCRVIGRSVESATLAAVADRARTAGALALEGWYIPSGKNDPARRTYLDHGFGQIGSNGDSTQWRYELSLKTLCAPPWIKLATEGDST